jgi:hypothetical protein
MKTNTQKLGVVGMSPFKEQKGWGMAVLGCSGHGPGGGSGVRGQGAGMGGRV